MQLQGQRLCGLLCRCGTGLLFGQLRMVYPEALIELLQQDAELSKVM